MTVYLARALVLAAACGWSGAGVSDSSAAAQQPDARRSAVTATAEKADSRPADFHRRTRAAIAEVLAGREFADLHADPSAPWRWLMDRIASLLGGIASFVRGMPSGLVWGIVGCMVLTLVVLLAHLIYTLVIMLSGISLASQAGRTPRGHPGQLLGILPLDFDAIYAEAHRLLDIGDWLAATKHLYVAAILWLDRQGCITFRLSKTNRDYVEELQARARLQAPFRRLTGNFEPIIYGGRSATMSTSQDMANTVESLLHESTGAVAN